MGIDRGAVREALRTFAGVPHRLERVAEIDGVLFVNDSKATNVAAAVAEAGLISHVLDDEVITARVSALIAEDKVVAWFRGRMEFGPRALGARSIIGDARSARMQTVMNLKIKFRESFRPFAPSVLRDKAADYFDFNHRGDSPYMLLVAPVPLALGKWVLLLGTTALSCVYVPLWRRQRDDAVLVQGFGAVLAAGAAVLWLGGVPVPVALPWLVGFVVLTSIVLHGATITPVMRYIDGRNARLPGPQPPRANRPATLPTD